MIPEDIPSALSIGKLLQHVIVARAYNSRAKMRFVGKKTALCPCVTLLLEMFVQGLLLHRRRIV